MGRSVLVVDDEWDIRETLAEFLRDGGQEVATARDGFDALGKLESVPRPCVILLDLMMPRMAGLEFLQHLSEHEHSGDFVVLVMSANDALRNEAAAFPNVRGALSKPFDLDGVLSVFEHGA
jgi:CheY-like chemotaxis protein